MVAKKIKATAESAKGKAKETAKQTKARVTGDPGPVAEDKGTKAKVEVKKAASKAKVAVEKAPAKVKAAVKKAPAKAKDAAKH